MSGNENQNPKKEIDTQTIHQKKSDEKMSNQTNDKNVFAVYTQSFDKIHSNVEKATPQYLQAFTNLQQEYLATWSNFVHSVFSIQQHYAKKVGINASVPDNTAKAVHNVTDEIVKAFDVQNKVVQTALDATKQNVKTINDNATAFADLNQNIVNSWISAWNKQN